MAISVADFAAFVRVSDTSAEYDALEPVLAAAQEYVDAVAGAPGATRVFRVYPTRRVRLVLPAHRLESVDGIVDPDGNAVAVADCAVDLGAGVITLPAAPASSGEYAVTVTVLGSAAADEATLVIAKHLWQARRGAQGSAGGAFASGDDQVPAGFAIPRRAAELLSVVQTPGFA